MCTAAAGSHDAARDGANAGACIDDAVTVDGAGDNDAARVAVVTDRLLLTIAMEEPSCTASGDIGSSHVRSTTPAHSKLSGLTSRTVRRWGEADKLAHLKASLVGDAGQVLWDSEASATDTLEKLTTLLRSRYSGSRQADKYRSELRLRSRRAGESLSTMH